MLNQEEYERLRDRLAARCGDDLVIWAEHMRQFVHVDGEDAPDDEGRVRAQAMAVVYRDMARMFRGELNQDAAKAVERDRAALQENQQR